MKRVLRILKMAVLTLVSVLLFFTLITIAFVNMSPQFGATPARSQQEIFETSSNYSDGKFRNQIPTTVGLSFRETVSVLGEFLFGDKSLKDPGDRLPIQRIDSTELVARSADIMRLTWFGHSAILLETEGAKMLIDPMLGQHAGPLPLISPKRFNEELPIEIEKLPFIDVVIISHDHYDHLDYGSIVRLKDKVGKFYVPLGVGAHLRSWGVKADIITELNWWQEAEHQGFNFICVPARHFSGRGFTNNITLWSSWIIQTSRRQFYFSGDSGYGPHFKEIGQKYGPMDFVMMECGQYNEKWPAIHMVPEETVQATIDVKGKVLLPIHWGAFTLAMHTWDDPINRVVAEANRLNVPIATPKIGEMILLDNHTIPSSRWW